MTPTRVNAHTSPAPSPICRTVASQALPPSSPQHPQHDAATGSYWVDADGAINIDWEDDIIKGVGLTRDGKVVHPNFAAAEPEPAPEPEPVEAEADAPAANGAVPETTPAENGSDETQ